MTNKKKLKLLNLQLNINQKNVLLSRQLEGIIHLLEELLMD